LKYDQDKTFGAVDLRRAFNQVDTLVRHGYGKKGEVVGLDVKAMRTQPARRPPAPEALEGDLPDAGRAGPTIDRTAWQGYVDARDYEGLELFIVKNLMGKA
jgi:xylose isomerase